MKLKLLSTLLISGALLASGQVFAQTDTAKPAAPAAAAPASATPAPKKAKKAKKSKAPVAPSNAAQRNNGPL